jgi:trans-aconitate methyltransferase
MLVDQYVNALLRDAVLADAVWELWNAGVFTDTEAAQAWVRVAALRPKADIRA